MNDGNQPSLFDDPPCAHCDGTGWTRTPGVQGVVRCVCVKLRRDGLKAEGLATAIEHSDDDWKTMFCHAIDDLIEANLSFTSETVTQQAGLPFGEVRSNRNNAIGAMFNAYARRGRIAKVCKVPSQRPRNHGAEIWLWRGTSRRTG